MRHDHPHAAWNFNEACRQCRRELEAQKLADRQRAEAERAMEEAISESYGMRRLFSPARGER